MESWVSRCGKLENGLAKGCLGIRCRRAFKIHHSEPLLTSEGYKSRHRLARLPVSTNGSLLVETMLSPREESRTLVVGFFWVSYMLSSLLSELSTSLAL